MKYLQKIMGWILAAAMACSMALPVYAAAMLGPGNVTLDYDGNGDVIADWDPVGGAIGYEIKIYKAGTATPIDHQQIQWGEDNTDWICTGNFESPGGGAGTYYCTVTALIGTVDSYARGETSQSGDFTYSPAVIGELNTPADLNMDASRHFGFNGELDPAKLPYVKEYRITITSSEGVRELSVTPADLSAGTVAWPIPLAAYLKDNISYAITVQSISNDPDVYDDSAQSAEFPYLNRVATEKLATPSNLRVTNNNGAFTLTFNGVDSAVSYEVQMRRGSSIETRTVNEGGPGRHSLNVTSFINASGTYFFLVRAMNRAPDGELINYSDWSSEYTYSHSPVISPLQQPPRPSLNAATEVLTFTGVPNAASYRLKMYRNSDGREETRTVNVSGTGTYTVNVSDFIAANGTYTFEIQAVSGNTSLYTDSPWSPVCTYTPSASAVPQLQQPTVASVNATTEVLTFNGVANAARYQLRMRSPDGREDTRTVNISGTGAHPVNVSDFITVNGTYYFDVRAMSADTNVYRNSLWSSPAYPYTLNNGTGGGTGPGNGGGTTPPADTGLRNVYSSAPKAGGDPYAVISTGNLPSGSSRSDLELRQETLADPSALTDLIDRSHVSKITSFLEDNPDWSGNAEWWDLYLYDHDAGSRIDNFKRSARIYIPVSTGINTRDYEYLLIHQDGSILETLSYNTTGSGITFTVNSLSPFVLLWRDRYSGSGSISGSDSSRWDRGDDYYGSGNSSAYNSFWNKVERYIEVARSGEYVDVVLPRDVDTVPDSVLEELADRSVTLTIEDPVTDRRYRLYGPDIDTDQLRYREYDLPDLYDLVGSRDNEDYSEPTGSDGYEYAPSTGGDGYIPISSSLPSGDSYNPGTGGSITLFSNSRTIDPLPEIDVVTSSSMRVEHDPVAMQVLVVFFVLAAALPFAEMWISRRKKPEPQTAKPQSVLPRKEDSGQSAQSIVRNVNANRGTR